MTLFATCYSCRGLTENDGCKRADLRNTIKTAERNLPAYMMLSLILLASFPNNMHVSLQAVDKLSGQWKLLYTINSELTGLLGLGRLPGVEVGEISQSVNGSMLSITNTVTIGGPVSRTAFSAKAAFEIMSPKRIQVCAALQARLHP